MVTCTWNDILTYSNQSEKFPVVFEKLPNVFVAASYPIISPSNMQDFTDD